MSDNCKATAGKWSENDSTSQHQNVQTTGSRSLRKSNYCYWLGLFLSCITFLLLKSTKRTTKLDSIFIIIFKLEFITLQLFVRPFCIHISFRAMQWLGKEKIKQTKRKTEHYICIKEPIHSNVMFECSTNWLKVQSSSPSKCFPPSSSIEEKKSSSLAKVNETANKVYACA